MITASEARRALRYDANTGFFNWLVDRGKRKAGSRAGRTNKFSGYVVIYISNKAYYAHRLAWLYMKGVWPKNQIDHDDHVRHNNRWNNLFEATNQDNSKNQTKRKTNTSGITGVSWKKEKSRFEVYITNNGRKIHLGYFDNLDEAKTARKEADIKYKFHQNHGVKN